jgi:hypothetical protein
LGIFEELVWKGDKSTWMVMRMILCPCKQSKY